MLATYNKNPYDLDKRKTTFQELYQMWSKEKFKSISESSINSYNNCYQLCKFLFDKKFSDLKLQDFQYVIDTCGKNYPTIRKVKIFLAQLGKYAVAHDIAEKNYGEFINIIQYQKKNPNKYEHTRFSKEEINLLWKYSNNKFIQPILVLVYTGLRISEFYNLKTCNVNLEKRYFKITESKTENGIRTVPIADKIYPFIVNFYNDNFEYLFHTPNGKKFTDHNFRDTYWNPAMELLNMNHKPHDTRHTTVSLLAEAKIDQTTIKKIVGHAGTLTQNVYTHLDLDVLLNAINKI